ncbi:MAG: plastocyanin/azurin family copper-binding protein [Meiothermus sp.]|nr:plastocyanin/azurin family copper-binding protein [Meiothermus sp.]
MRILGLATLVVLSVSCGESSNPNPDACQVVRMVSTQAGFRLVNTNSANVIVKAGGCIEFVNDDPSSVHNAQSRPNAPSNLAFNTAILARGESQKVVFNIAGEVEYICGVGSHATTMSGRITVQP